MVEAVIHIGMYKVAFEKIMKKIADALKHPYFSEYHSEENEVKE